MSQSLTQSHRDPINTLTLTHSTVTLQLNRCYFCAKYISVHNKLNIFYKKGKSVPLQAWSGPEGSRKLRFPDYVTMAQGGGKVVSLMHRPPLPPRKCSRYSFMLEAESTPGP